MRINAYQREVLLLLYGTVQMLEHHEQDLGTLSRRVKNGYRDMRMALTVLNKLLRNVMDTVPAEQQMTVLRHMKISEIKIATKDVTGRTEDDWLLSRDDIAQLVNAATEKCLMCDNTTGKGCELARLIDELPVDVTNTLYVGCKK